MINYPQMKNISKSSAIIQKEKQIKLLEASKKKISAQIKRNKTMLANLKSQIDEMGREQANNLQRMMDVSKIVKEIKNLFAKLLKSKKIKKSDKQEIEEFSYAIDDLNDGMEPLDELNQVFEEMKNEKDFEDFFSEKEQQKSQMNLFEEFEVEMDEKDAKEFRKLFLKLIKQAHPDLAKNKKEEKIFNSISIQLNQAKKRGDYDALLKIQKELSEMDFDNLEMEDSYLPLTDLLDDRITIMETEINALKRQLARLKMELKEVRSSDFGQFHKQTKKQKKYHGQDMNNSQLEGQEMHEELKELKKCLEDYLKTGKRPENFERFFVQADFPFDESMFDEFDPEEADEDELVDMLDFLSNIMHSMNEEKPKKRKSRKKRK